MDFDDFGEIFKKNSSFEAGSLCLQRNSENILEPAQFRNPHNRQISMSGVGFKKIILKKKMSGCEEKS